MIYIIVAVAVILIFVYNKLIDTQSFFNDVKPIYRKLMEKDYEFLLHVKYKAADLDINKLFEIRLRNGILTILIGMFALYVTNYFNYVFMI